MTKQNKLIVGAVVLLVAYYLYDRNKKMKAVSKLKAGADIKVEEVPMQPQAIKKAIAEKPLKFQELNREVL